MNHHSDGNIALKEIDSSDHELLWEEAKKRLHNEVGAAQFRNWISHLSCEGIDGGTLMLGAPTRFIREWNVKHFRQKITSHAAHINSKILRIDIRVMAESEAVKQDRKSATLQHGKGGDRARKSSLASSNSNQQKYTPTLASGVDVTGQNIDLMTLAEDQQRLSSPLDQRYRFEHFIQGATNQLALSAAQAIARPYNYPMQHNMLYLYGGVGMGKTHLMHAIAHDIAEHDPHLRVVYLSAEKFMFHFVTALREKNMMAFKEAFRYVDVLLMDDIQFICNKESTQEEFYYTVCALQDAGKRLIVAGDRSPLHLTGMQPRMQSRLSGGLVADIHAAPYELRSKILRSKLGMMPHMHVPGVVVDFLAQQVQSNIRELEGALYRVMAHVSLHSKPLTIDDAKTVLADILRANDQTVTVSRVQKQVADYYQVRLADMSSASRARAIVRPRQVAMYLAKQYTVRSLAEIGARFGRKDHTTVMHAIKRIDSLRVLDNELDNDIKTLEKRIITA